MWDLEKILTVSAAWVQAFGSIVALVVAFKVASRQANRDEIRRAKDHAEWRDGLYDLALEAKKYVEAAMAMKDPTSGEAYAKMYDRAYARTIASLLYDRVSSERMRSSEIAPTLAIRSELTKTQEAIEQCLPRLEVKQFPFEIVGFIAERSALIGHYYDELLRHK